MERRSVLTAEEEAKFRAEIDEIRKRFHQVENNYDDLLGYFKHKRPCLFLPKTSGPGCPLEKKRQNSLARTGFYHLTTYDSDDESTTREHDYCNPRHFTGFTRSEVMDSVNRYFRARDSEFVVASEISFPPDEPKKPLHIKLELSESELIQAYDHETHYGYLLDPDFRVDKMSPASVEELGTEDFDEELLNALLPSNGIPDETIPSHDFPDVTLPDSNIHDSMLSDSCIPDYTLPVKGVHGNLLRKVNGRKEEVERSLGGDRCSDLLSGEDHSVHDNIVLDSNQAELFQLNENNVSDQSIFMNDENVESDGNFHCEGDDFSRSSAPLNICVNDGEGDDAISVEQEAAECELPEIEEEEESVRSGYIVVAGDSEGEFIGDADTYSRDPDSESRVSDLSLPNVYPDSGSETSFSRPGSATSFSRPPSTKGWESDVTSTCTSGISLVDIDPEVDPSLGEIYGHSPGIKINTSWSQRSDLARSGCHRPTRDSIHIGPVGVYSLLLQNALAVKDFGDSVVVYGGPAYTSTARKSKTRRRTTFNKRRKRSKKKCDQTMTRGNLALYYSMIFENPIRVVRSHSMKSAFSPSTGYQYGGLFYVYSIHIVKTYEQIREFRFILISDPSLFASREAPRLWQLEGKLPPPTPVLLNFGHPRDTVIGKGCRESVQETSPLRPVQTVDARLVKDSRRQASKRIATDSKREERLRRTRSVSSGSRVETRSVRRSRLSAAESVVNGKPESMLGETENTVAKLVSKRQLRKSVKTTIEDENRHAKPATVVPAESVKIYPRKRTRPTTVAEVQSSELRTENKSMDPRKEEKYASVKLRRLGSGDNTVPGPSESDPSLKTGASVRTRSHNRSCRKRALWLEKVEKWNTDLY